MKESHSRMELNWTLKKSKERNKGYMKSTQAIGMATLRYHVYGRYRWSNISKSKLFSNAKERLHYILTGSSQYLNNEWQRPSAKSLWKE